MEITLPNSQGNQSFRSVAGKRSNGRAVYLGDPGLALLGRSPVGVEKSGRHDALPSRRRFCVFWESAAPRPRSIQMLDRRKTRKKAKGKLYCPQLNR